jgi:hypothetical protein
MVKGPVTASTLERVSVTQSWLLFEALQNAVSARRNVPNSRNLLGKTNGLPDSWVRFLNDGGNGGGLSIADDGLKLRGAAGGNISNNSGEVVVGARPKCTETLQPGVDGVNDGTGGPLQENLNKTVGVEAVGLWGSGNTKDGVLASGGNVTSAGNGWSDLKRGLCNPKRMDKLELSECTANSRND